MTHSQQYYPLPIEYLYIGVLGIILYCSIIYLSISSMILGFRSKSTKRFFASIMIMSILELPRYFSLAITESYTSKTTYCFHIIAGIFFFLSFTIVCRQWSGLLQLGSYFRVVYGYHSLIISNITFAIMDIISVGFCAASHSLNSYFDSDSFEVITFLEGMRNCVYSIFLAYYGLKLVQRFWHFSKLEKQSISRRKRIGKDGKRRKGKGPIKRFVSSFFHSITFLPDSFTTSKGSKENSNIASSFDAGPLASSNSENSTSNVSHLPLFDTVFTRVVYRLTFVLSLTTLCFLFRLAMLIMKMIALHANSTYTNEQFSLFGLAWFTCSDFIPRGLPSIAFIFLMRTKKPVTTSAATTHTLMEKKGKRSASNEGGGYEGKSIFQFVVFSSSNNNDYDEDEEGDEDEESDDLEGYYTPSNGGSDLYKDLQSQEIISPFSDRGSRTHSLLKGDQFKKEQYYYDNQHNNLPFSSLLPTTVGMNPNHSVSSFENMNKTLSFPRFSIHDHDDDNQASQQQEEDDGEYDNHDEEVILHQQSYSHTEKDFRDSISQYDEDEEDYRNEENGDDLLNFIDPSEIAIEKLFSLITNSPKPSGSTPNSPPRKKLNSNNRNAGRGDEGKKKDSTTPETTNTSDSNSIV
jgi:hypothetical protein